jgi:hypothetical protein
LVKRIPSRAYSKGDIELFGDPLSAAARTTAPTEVRSKVIQPPGVTGPDGEVIAFVQSDQI